LQVEHYDARNPAPGFTRAKDFAGSLRAGPLLAVGDASVWPRLTASLTLNGEIRQTLRAADCQLDPARLHRELFAGHEGDPWLLAATGTAGGTLFRSPQIRERLLALVAGGFSLKRARLSWLNGLRFLAPGDTLVLESPVLGRAESRIL
jgi:2-keto-4-pentenoate hydratase/2-oxohepta-3-ene-1,7-dioic acid hydratase in catechol pathway